MTVGDPTMFPYPQHDRGATLLGVVQPSNEKQRKIQGRKSRRRDLCPYTVSVLPSVLHLGQTEGILQGNFG